MTADKQAEDAFRTDALRYRMRTEMHLQHALLCLEKAGANALTLAFPSNREAPEWPGYSDMAGRIDALFMRAQGVLKELEELQEP